MKNLKELKGIATDLKLNKVCLADFDGIMINRTQIGMTNFETGIIFNVPDTNLGYCKITKDVLDLGINEKTTSKINKDSFDALFSFDTNETGEINLNNSLLSDVINGLDFVTTDDLRPVMTGICINGGICATDAHKLYYNLDEVCKDEVILRPDFVKIIKRLKLESVKLYYNKKFAFIRSNDLILWTHLIDAKFPNYKAVIPQHSDFTITISKKETLTALKQLKAVYGKSKTKKISLFPKFDKIVLRSENIDFGIEHEIILNNVKHNLPDDYIIGYRGDFFTTCLNPLSENITMELSQPNRATLFNNKVLLMPVML